MSRSSPSARRAVVGDRCPRRSAAGASPISCARSFDLAVGLLGDRGRRQVAEPERAVGVRDDAVEVEPAVDDAGVVQPAQVVPQRADVEPGRGRRRRRPLERCRQRHPLGSHDDEGVAAPGAAGRDQARDAHAGPLGEQRDEAFVLDEIDAAEAGVALAAAVPRQPPQRGEQLGIPRVAPVDLDEQRTRLGRCPRTARRPAGCIAAGARSSTNTPSSARAILIRDSVGRPPGDP